MSSQLSAGKLGNEITIHFSVCFVKISPLPSVNVISVIALTHNLSPDPFLPFLPQTYQCSAESRSQATEMCTDIFSCPSFEMCGQVVDIDWYMSTCIQVLIMGATNYITAVIAHFKLTSGLRAILP